MLKFNLTHQSITSQYSVDTEILLTMALMKNTTKRFVIENYCTITMNRLAISILINLSKYVEMTDFYDELVKITLLEMSIDNNLKTFMKKLNITVTVDLDNRLFNIVSTEFEKYGVKVVCLN